MDLEARLESGTRPRDHVRIAVVGCCHGELELIYNLLGDIAARENRDVDLLICCGDFQATRNEADLACMACPVKHRSMVSFYKYYSGERRAPVPTIFIHGNHEASNHLTELYHGGWVAPNIYYMGYAGVVRFGGLRIAGYSGIYNRSSYNLGHFETCPYSDSQMRTVYHHREYEKFQLAQLKGPIDIFLSHDWPRNIHRYGDERSLLRVKPHFMEDIQRGDLGSPAHEELLSTLKPKYWFAGHMHVKFPAIVRHSNTPGDLTRFVALDKPIPNRDFLQVLDIPVEPTTAPFALEYDDEWLAILRNTWNLFPRSSQRISMPNARAPRAYVPPALVLPQLADEERKKTMADTTAATTTEVKGEDPKSSITSAYLAVAAEAESQKVRYNFTPTSAEMELARKLALMVNGGNLLIDPSRFIQTAPVYVDRGRFNPNAAQPSTEEPLNPQSAHLCNMLGVEPGDHFQVYVPSAVELLGQKRMLDAVERGTVAQEESSGTQAAVSNPDEIDLDGI